LAAYEGQSKTLREQYQAALDAGQTARASELIEAMTEVKVKQNEAKNYKTWLDGEKARAEAAAKQRQQTPQAPVYTARTQAWIDEHPEYLTDRKFQLKCQAADADAQAEGIQRDTDEYFQHVNKFLGLTKAAAPEPAAEDDGGEVLIEPTPAPVRKQTVSTAAPVSRTGAATMTNGERPASRNNFKLSADEAEIARISFPTEYKEDPAKAYRAYWDNKQVLIKEGKIGA